MSGGLVPPDAFMYRGAQKSDKSIPFNSKYNRCRAD